MVNEMALVRCFLRVLRFYRDTTLHQYNVLIHSSPTPCNRNSLYRLSDPFCLERLSLLANMFHAFLFKIEQVLGSIKFDIDIS